MGFTRKTEIKDISSLELGKIAKLLNHSYAWKKLMQAVPMELTHPENLSEGQSKYSLQHIKLIENATLIPNNHKSAALIFFEEWMTTGKIRPTLGHLVQLLIKCELFGAADHVAMNLLSEEAPQRPSKGPAAKVDISLPNETDDIPKHPNPTELMNLNDRIRIKQNPGKEVLTVNTPMKQTRLNIQSHQLSSIRSEDSHRPDDQLNISTHVLTATTPYANNILPNVSLLNVQSYELSSDSIQRESNIIIPNMSILNNGTDSLNLNNLNLSDHGENMNFPNLSILHLDNGDASHQSIEQRGYSENIPHFSALMNHSQSS